MADLSNADALHVLDAQYGGYTPSGFTPITSTATDPAYAANGVDGVAFQNDQTGQVVVSYAGHAMWPWSPYYNKDRRIYQGKVDVNDDLRKYGDKFLQQVKQNIHRGNQDVNGAIVSTPDIKLDGMSEGGYIAQLVSQDSGLGGNTYGAPGVLGNSNPQHTIGNMQNYMTSGDTVPQFATDGSLASMVKPGLSADHVGQITQLNDGSTASPDEWSSSHLYDAYQHHNTAEYEKLLGVQKGEKKKTSARKDDSNMMITKGPDVLKTPVGGQMVPVPYNSAARLGQGQRLASSVFVNGRQDFHLDSRSEIIQGHEPGTGKGVVVPGYMKFSHAKTTSSTVFSEGFSEVRDGDPAWINHPTVGPEEPSRTKDRPSILPMLWAQKHLPPPQSAGP